MRRFFSFLLLFASLFFFVSSLISSNLSASPSARYAILQPGEVQVNQTISPTSNRINQWDATLTIEAKNKFPPPSQDVLLILDVSGSMNTVVDTATGETRLDKMKETAKNFVQQVLQDEYDNRLSLITYSNDIVTQYDYLPVEKKAELLTMIDQLNAKGGTYTQKVLHEAVKQVEKSARLKNDAGGKVKRSVVVLSDGAPTYSSPPQDLKIWGVPYLNGQENMALVGTRTISNKKYLEFATKDTVDAFDHTQRVGNGASIRYNMGSKAPALLDEHIPQYIKDLHPDYHASQVFQLYDHVNSTIAEGRQMQKQTYASNSEPIINEIYTIGLDLSHSANSQIPDEEIWADKVLSAIATNGHYYKTNSVDLDDIMKQISGKMISTVQKGSIEIPLKKGIQLTNGEKSIKVSQGTVKVTQRNEQTILEWDTGVLNQTIPNSEDHMIATIDYQVEGTSTLLQSGVIDTNGNTYLSDALAFNYEDIDEKQHAKSIIQSVVKPIIVSLEKYLFDSAGKEEIGSAEAFAVKIGNDAYTANDQFVLHADGSEIKIIHPWETAKDYTVEEMLTNVQDFSVSIDINGTKTQGNQTQFRFSDQQTAQHQKIRISNQRNPQERNVYLNVRQVVVDAHSELALPKKAFYQATVAQQMQFNLTSESTIKNTASEVTEDLFTRYEVSLDKQYHQLVLQGIVPEYYMWAGYVATDTATDLADRHLFTNQAECVSTATVILDYQATKEYWVTFFITKKFGTTKEQTSEQSPRMYSWDYGVGQFN